MPSTLSAFTTPRLTLTPLSTDDAPFILTLLNDPGWLRFIGDRGVRTVDQARAYIENGSVQSYARHGFGAFLVRLTATGIPLGVCGLYQRDFLPGPDIGFAFLPQFTGHGYAREATSAIMTHARAALGHTRFLAIAAPDNTASLKLLAKLGLRFDRAIRVAADREELSLYTTDPAPAAA